MIRTATLAIALSASFLAAKAQFYVPSGAQVFVGTGDTLTVRDMNATLDAAITGTGTLRMAGNTAQTINGAAASVPRLTVANASGVSLGSAMTVASSILFAAGPLNLGANNLTLSTGGTTSGASAASHVVTNGAGVMTVSGVAQNSVVTFPIGATAADYSPATITNTAAATRAFNARVMPYATATAVAPVSVIKGVDRVWQVYSDAAGTATVGLSNDNALNTLGTAFDPTKTYVTQQGATLGMWSVSSATTNGGTSPNVAELAGLTVPATGDNTSYFSKTSNTLSSLRAGFSVNATALLQGAWPTSGSPTAMSQTLNTNNLIPLQQPFNYAAMGNFAGTDAVTAIPANVTDWILLDLRSATTPTTITATRAAFIKTDGTIVDLDGVSPVFFTGVPAGNYHIGVRHRNHLAIRTAAAQTFALDGSVTYDFSRSMSSAYDSTSLANRPMAQLVNGRFGMWGGNANGNGFVNYGASGTDRFFMVTAPRTGSNPALGLGNTTGTPITSTYSNSDLNLNGFVNYGASGTDRFFLVVTVLGNASNVPRIQHL